MSREYTSKLIGEIDLYLENLRKFQSFDFSALDATYAKLIEELNASINGLVNEALTKAKSAKKIQTDGDAVIRESRRELETLENQLRTIQNNEEDIKKKISSIRRKIKKAQTEHDHIAENLNDPLRRLLGYKNSDQEKINSLDAEIKDYEDEIVSLKETLSDELKKTLESRIQTVKENIKEHEKFFADSLKNEQGAKVDEKAVLEALCITLQTLFEDKLSEFNSIEAVETLKKVLRKINTTEIKGYALMHYKSLLEVVSLYPNNLFDIGLEKTRQSFLYGIELDESFSAVCRESFKNLCCIRPKGTVDVQKHWDELYISRMKAASGEFVFPFSPVNLSLEDFYNVIYEDAKSQTLVESPFDVLIEEAAKFAIEEERISSSMLQRKFLIGYGRANQIINELEQLGIVSGAQGAKPRDIWENDLSKIDFSGRGIKLDSKNRRIAKVSQVALDRFELSKEEITTDIIKISYISEKFLMMLREMLEENPNYDLPDIAIELREDEIDEHRYIAEEFLAFRNLYNQLA